MKYKEDPLIGKLALIFTKEEFNEKMQSVGSMRRGNDEFFNDCGGKLFKITDVDRLTGERVKLDFSSSKYKPERSGFVGMRAIKKICNSNVMDLQDELFQL